MLLAVAVFAGVYSDYFWDGRIYYAFHKQIHGEPQVEYHVHSSIEDLGSFTWSQARAIINEAAAEWNSASEGSFKFANVQDTEQNTQIYSKYCP